MKRIYKYFLTIFFFLYCNNSIGQECASSSTLKVGLLDDSFIDYRHYLYYELGNYALNENIDFEFKYVDGNVDQFDLIFGEYYELNKLSLSNLDLSDTISDFYRSNGVFISNNLLPLDLDTYILSSQIRNKNMDNFEDLAQYFDPIRYTLGISLLSPKINSEIIDFNLDSNTYDISNQNYERALNLFNKTYPNINKNILSSNFMEIKSSYENNENVFTLFSDGVILHKDFKYSSYQLFSQSNYQWDHNEGVFKERLETTPYSYFGFSAYVNNSKKIGFICHLIKPEVRVNTFKNFDISVSPFSEMEIVDIKSIDENYLNILELKNDNIRTPKYEWFDENFDLNKKIIFGNIVFEDLIDTDNYLNNR